jgi:hypothetical protein
MSNLHSKFSKYTIHTDYSNAYDIDELNNIQKELINTRENTILIPTPITVSQKSINIPLSSNKNTYNNSSLQFQRLSENTELHDNRAFVISSIIWTLLTTSVLYYVIIRM